MCLFAYTLKKIILPLVYFIHPLGIDIKNYIEHFLVLVGFVSSTPVFPVRKPHSAIHSCLTHPEAEAIEAAAAAFAAIVATVAEVAVVGEEEETLEVGVEEMEEVILVVAVVGEEEVILAVGVEAKDEVAFVVGEAVACRKTWPSSKKSCHVTHACLALIWPIGTLDPWTKGS